MTDVLPRPVATDAVPRPTAEQQAARLRSRYRADRRFRLYGLGAIAMAVNHVQDILFGDLPAAPDVPDERGGF